jgi:hypothetical protein
MGSRSQPEYVDVETYLVIEPKWSEWGSDAQDRPILSSAKVAKTTTKRPEVTKGGVVTKVKFRIDAGCFLPLQPEAVVHVHAGNAETIEVEALDPREDDEE